MEKLEVLDANVLTTGLMCAAIWSQRRFPNRPFIRTFSPSFRKTARTAIVPAKRPRFLLFMSYESTRPTAKAIKSAVLTKKMPPWFADPQYGKFANDRTLSEADMKTLVAWVDGGAKAGNMKEAPKPMTFVEGWNIGKPDVVLKCRRRSTFPPRAPSIINMSGLPTGFTEDKYVQFAEARPTDRVAHASHHRVHSRSSFQWIKDAPIGRAVRSRDAKEGGGGEGGGGFGGDFLAGYAPGNGAGTLKPGQAKLIPKGRQRHHLPAPLHRRWKGEAETRAASDIFAKEQPTERLLMLGRRTAEFADPRGRPEYRSGSKITLQADSTLISFAAAYAPARQGIWTSASPIRMAAKKPC